MTPNNTLSIPNAEARASGLLQARISRYFDYAEDRWVALP
jgi:hypothetical protein